MDILNGAIESLISSSNKEDWTPVALNVADATVTISKHQVRHGRHRQTAVPSFPAVLSLFTVTFTLNALVPDCVLLSVFVLYVLVTLISTYATRMKRRCWWSVVFVFCLLWVSAGTCTLLPSSWMSVDIVSTVTSSGVNPTLAMCPRPYKQPAW